MSTILRKAAHHIGGIVPGVRMGRRLRHLNTRLDHVDSMLRRLEHLTLGSSATFLGNNRVLVRVIAGQHMFWMLLQADDKLISPSMIVNGRYEPELTNHLTRHLRLDSHCLDVGANLGYFTCLMAKYASGGQVIGLEPNPEVFALTVENILLNALHERAQALNLAAGDAAGEQTLYRRVGRAGNTSFAACGEDFTRALHEPPEQAFTISTVRVDDLRERLSGRVDFMKIDVEGAEPLVIAGAHETIVANPQLHILMEWSPAQIIHAGFDVARFVSDLAGLGLRPHVLTGAEPQAISADEMAGLPYQAGLLLCRARP